LKAVAGGTLMTFRHSAFGFVPDDIRQGLARGWRHFSSASRSRLKRLRALIENRR
jgi:hypothetical protein